MVLAEVLSCARTMVQFAPVPLLVTRIISAVEMSLPSHIVQLNGAAGNDAPLVTIKEVPELAGLGAVATVLLAKLAWASKLTAAE